MSHDFRTAGRRAVAAIGSLHLVCSANFHLNSTTDVPLCDLENDAGKELTSKAAKAVVEADAQHDNAVDKQAVGLLRNYHMATLDEVEEREAIAVKAFAGQAPGVLPDGRFIAVQHHDYCDAEACEAMFATCKKEAEQAFETGIMPAKVQCKSLSPRDSK
jgi:hypothetical protein